MRITSHEIYFQGSFISILALPKIEIKIYIHYYQVFIIDEHAKIMNRYWLDTVS